MEEEKSVSGENEPAPKKEDENIVYQEVREERFHRLRKAGESKGFFYYFMVSVFMILVISATFALSVFLGKQFVQVINLKKNSSAIIPETIPKIESKFKAAAPEVTVEAQKAIAPSSLETFSKAIAPTTDESFAKTKKGLKIKTTTVPSSNEALKSVSSESAAKPKIAPAIKKAEAAPKTVSTGLSSSGYYKVQAGLFCAKANAKSLITNLKQQGFSTYLKLQKDGMYRVQVGAFRTEKEAKDLAKKLKSKYFESTVIYE